MSDAIGNSKFLGLVWLWAKERVAPRDTNTTPADLELVGYMFMVVARWFVCGAQLCSGGLGMRRATMMIDRP